jgi:hypothetical protein
MSIGLRRLSSLFALSCLVAEAIAAEPYRIERFTAATGTDTYYFTQSRAAIISEDMIVTLPSGTQFANVPGPGVMIVSQETEKEGSHRYRDLWQLESIDLGKTWSAAKRIPELARKKLPNGDEQAIGDVTPAWHEKTETVLATGKTFTFRGGTKEDRLAEQVSYAVFKPTSYNPLVGTWSEMKILALPEKDKSGAPLTSPNSGCQQRVDLPNGDILLPVRYRRGREAVDYTTIVTRCKFDGRTLTYVEHGNELHHTNGRGFGEPSLAKFGDRYFLTIRNEAAGYVASSDDGLNYSKPIQWTYDDGTPVPTYNTQQHWVAHETHGLYLVYTRRGAGNDHIFRHRAPLFIARVDTSQSDPAKLQLIKATEQILMPHDHADLGNFGVTVVSPSETWVVAGEGLQLGKRNKERNKVLVAKILWEPSTNSPPPRPW